jgi:NhaA family Na+:H+ antiporter
VSRLRVVRPSRGRLFDPFRTIAQDARLSSILLIAVTLAALVWANSPWGASYDAVWERPTAIGFRRAALTLTVREWINDALMAVFFLVVGLEIERELLVGTLRDIRAAALPIAAALGGMLVPAGIYWLIAARSPYVSGWGIPMATDIAFALGLLGLLAPGVPPVMRAFLAALAIIDDLGAILVIAFGYGAAPAWDALLGATLCVALLVVMRARDVRAITPYFLMAVPLWLFLHAGGIHPSLTGIVVAFAIPPTSAHDRGESPSLRTERALHGWVAAGVLPLFALANGGVHAADAIHAPIPTAAMLGVIAGLVVGKPLGIFGATWLAVRSGIARLPEGLTWRRVGVVGLFGGIGFTMSIFVTSLAFTDAHVTAAAKSAVLAASVVAAVLGGIAVRLVEPRVSV